MTTTSIKTSAPAIYSHTGLRGIAAMYVLLFHLLWAGGDLRANKFCQWFQWGGYSVDLFFILSGFILNWVYLSSAAAMNWETYLKARVARILPLYLLHSFIHAD
jgi:peptidoglycan/LPS O-acetylase OafA/YrhL